MNESSTKVCFVAVAFALAACSADARPEGSEATGITQSALTTTVLEAENATGAGVVVNDATASGGQLRAISTSYTGATQTFATTGTLVSGVVRLRRSGTCVGLDPWYIVRIDGVSVAAGNALPATWTDVPISGSLGIGTHTVEYYDRHTDPGCTIQFDKLTLTLNDPPPPPVTLTLEAEGAVGSGAIVNDATASNGQLRSFTTPYTGATQAFVTGGPLASGTVRLRRSGTCTAPNPYFELRIDGVVRASGSSVPATWTDYPIAGTLAAGNHSLEYYYRFGNAGCALQFDKATITYQP